MEDGAESSIEGAGVESSTVKPGDEVCACAMESKCRSGRRGRSVRRMDGGLNMLWMLMDNGKCEGEDVCT